MNSIQLNYNQRENPLLNPKVESKQTCVRIFQASLPFLSFYKRANLSLSVISGGLQSTVRLIELKKTYDKGSWKEVTKEGMYIALLVASVSLMIFRPGYAMALSHTYAISVDVKDLATHLWKGELRETREKSFKLVSTSVFLASEYYSRSELIAASLVITALKEFYDSFAEFKKGRYIETFSKLFLAMIRSYQSKSHISRVYRKHFGKVLTQVEWEGILKEVKTHVQKEVVKPRGRGNGTPAHKYERLKKMSQEAWTQVCSRIFDSYSNKNRDLENYLIKGNFSNRLCYLDISDQDLMGMKLRNIEFIECNFNETNLRESELASVRFETCSMKKVLMIGAKLQDLIFLSSDLEKAVFYMAQGKSVVFIDTNLSSTCFNNSTWERLHIFSSNLLGANFLATQASRSLIEKCDLTNVLLAGAKQFFSFKDCTAPRVSKLVIALGWGFSEGGGYAEEVENALEDQDVLVMRYEYTPEELDPDILKKELNLKLEEESQRGFSIGDRLLHYTKETPEVEKAKRSAEQILHYSDGLIIPGGDDVEPELYKPDVHPTEWEGDHRRSILEYSLIALCRQRKVPLMGHCRGLQVVNAYLGGTIKAVENQFDRIQKLEYSLTTEAGQFLREIIGEDIYGLSFHEQAADRIASDLEVALRVDEEGGIVKAMISRDRLFLLTQFHPEAYSSIRKDLQKYYEGDEETRAELHHEVFWKIAEEKRKLIQKSVLLREEFPEKFKEVKVIFEGCVADFIRKYQGCLPGENFYRYFLQKVSLYKACSRKENSKAAPAA